MKIELFGQIESIITELVLLKNDISHNDFRSGDKRVVLIQKYTDQLQRQVFHASRVSGEVK